MSYYPFLLRSDKSVAFIILEELNVLFEQFQELFLFSFGV